MDQQYLANYTLDLLIFLGEIGLMLATILILVIGLVSWLQITNPNISDHQK